MNALSKADRDRLVSNVIKTVQTKHFDPHFDNERWRSEVERRRCEIVEAASQRDFEFALSELVRSFGTPESGFFHESTRKSVPKGLAARFQYCQPNECAPALTAPSEAGDVMISRIGEIGRASCRERVSISVVAVSLKKKREDVERRERMMKKTQ